MCEFCEPNGRFEGKDISKQIAVESIDVGMLCDVLQLDAWLFTDRKGANPRINIALETQETTGEIAEINIPIKYCPVCGKRLVN